MPCDIMQVLPFGVYGFSIAVYVISITVAISGLLIGAGYAINDRKLKETGKNELLQSMINGILVGSLLLLFSSNGIISSIIRSLTLANGTTITCSSFLSNNTAICLSYDYLVSPTPYTFMGSTHYSILSTVTGLLVSLFSLNVLLGIIASTKINLLIISFSFGSALNPIQYEIQYLIKVLSTVAISATVQASVLMFVAISALSVILPLGLILRTFYPTRKLGGFLIASAIGLYVVLPLSYVFNATIENAYSTNVNSTSLTEATISATNLKNAVFSLNIGANSIGSFGVINSLADLSSGLTSALTNMINGIISAIAYLIMYTFVLPIFSLIITGLSIKELSELLGSEAFFGRFDIL